MQSDGRTTWHVAGMDCASCAGKITRAVGRLPGVSEVEVNLLAERLSLRLAPGGATAEAVERQVAALGHELTPLAETPALERPTVQRTHMPHGHPHGHHHAHGEEDAGEEGRSWLGNRKARLVLLLAALVGAAFLAAWWLPVAAPWLYLGATLAALVPFGRRAIALARAGSPFSIETLMVTAALGATAIGAAEEAAMVVLLFALGEWLEGIAAGRARAGIRSLMALMPRTALREAAGGRLESVPAEALRSGEVVLVRPGERVPCDGIILDGHSALDESPVTGESMPVPRGPGEAVVAGSVNAEGALRLRVTEAGENSTLARIARMVAEATASRGRTQRFIERFSEVWTPGAMAVSALVILLPPLLLGGAWETWLYRGLALLLVACPCALVISVPAAVASGLSAGARRGLLVKGGAALEAIGTARRVAFDKTGTLTEGRPRVTDLLPAGSEDATGLLRLAAAVERGSAHPLAHAVVAEAERRGVDVPPARAAAAIPGKAAAATVEGRRIGVGSPAWAAGGGAILPDHLADGLATLEGAGKTVVVVTAGRAVLGLLALRDEPRADAAPGIAALRRQGVEPVMLTGDNPRTAAAIGGALGLESRAGLLPADKLRAVEALRAEGPVVMVGDGINDAPALAAATAGIAMGGGTAVALEVADAALLRERVTGVAELVALSRATLRNVKQNVAVAVGLKLLFLITTVTGVTGLWPAILADTGATVLVTLNALRLLRWRPAGV